MARICIITHSHYPYDARVSRQARALVRAGHDVDVICLKYEDQPFHRREDGVSVYRFPIGRLRGGKLRYLFEFVVFQAAATALAGMLHLRHRYSVVETTSVPDWLVFAALVPKLLGARVLLDLHECMPEYGATKYGVPLEHRIVRVLTFLERASIRFADFVTTCTEQMRERFVERGAPAEKIDVVLNSFDDERFTPERYLSEMPASDSFTLICHGTVEPNYGLDLAVRAVGILRDRIPRLRLEIWGDGTHRPDLEALTRELGLGDRVVFNGWVTMDKLMPHLAAAHAGVVAVRRDPFRDVTLCTKMFDLVSLHKPLIISRTRAVDAYFGDDCFQIFESGDEQDLAEAIFAVYADPALRLRLVRNATARNEPYRWVHQARRYVEIVERLAGRTRAASPRGMRAESPRETLAEVGEKA
ncbi:MAG TPA: glycosyltransferase family 4 protein [Candidatus Limnocylindria bacterium]|jgi:glycosyltransferase involved in cell wall biosynthesis|nr:glycosyltransferase family 4 protein [Candidatus Limnocylindria bacterium]